MSQETKKNEKLIAKLTKDVDCLSAYILLRQEEAEKKLLKARHELSCAHGLLMMIFGDEDDFKARTSYTSASYLGAEQEIGKLRDSISRLEGEIDESRHQW